MYLPPPIFTIVRKLELGPLRKFGRFSKTSNYSNATLCHVPYYLPVAGIRKISRKLVETRFPSPTFDVVQQT